MLQKIDMRIKYIVHLPNAHIEVSYLTNQNIKEFLPKKERELYKASYSFRDIPFTICRKRNVWESVKVKRVDTITTSKSNKKDVNKRMDDWLKDGEGKEQNQTLYSFFFFFH